MAEGKKKFRCCIYLHSGAYDRVHQAISIATVVLAMGGEAHIFCSYGALKRFVKGNVDLVVIEGEVAPFKDDLEKNVKRGTLDTITEMLGFARRFPDFRLYACTASMAVLNVTRDELIDEVDSSMGLVGFQNFVKDAEQVLYI